MADIAFAPNNSRYREAIATIMPLYPSVLHIASYEDRDAASLEELLAGATVYAGPPGSSPRLLSEGIVDDLNFAPGVVTFMDVWDASVARPDVIILYVPIDREEDHEPGPTGRRALCSRLARPAISAWVLRLTARCCLTRVYDPS